MIDMSAKSVLARVSASVKAMPVEMRAILAVCLAVSVVGLIFTHPLVSMIGIGLGGAIVMGQERK